MFAVIFDDMRIDSWSVKDSLLKLSVFSDNLYSRFVKSISRISPEKIIVFSKNDIKNLLSDGVELFDNISELSTLFFSSTEEYSVVFSSSVFVDINKDFVSIINKNAGEYKIVNDNKEPLCGVFSNKNIAEKLKESRCRFKDILKETDAEAMFNGYSQKIDNPLNYKAFLSDILQQKTSLLLPEVAQGVYAEDKIPDGNFVIVPPVYFDIGVQVEEGAVIGPCTILMSDTLISKKSEIRKSVILNDGYVSSGCLIDNSILSENVSVRRNSVVMGGSVLGHDSSVGEETIIENNSVILPFTKVDELKKNYVNFKIGNNDSPAGFYGYSPEKSALLGAALGRVFNSPRIAVASDGEMNSTALKLALMGGLITTGAVCYDFGNTFLSSLHYFMSFCELDCAAFISGNRFGTIITVFTKNSYSLTSSQYYNIKALMVSEKIDRCSFDECKRINQIHGMSRMYIQNLIKDFSEPLSFMPVFKCYNKRILNVVEIAISKIGYKSVNKQYVIELNPEGTKVRIESENVIYPDSKIREIVAYFNNDISNLWEYDSVILCFELLRTFNQRNLDFKSAQKLLPRFYVAEKELNYNGSMCELINKLGNEDTVKYKSGEIVIERGENKILVNHKSDSLRIIAKSSTTETAQEMVGDIVKIISSTALPSIDIK